jgi:hypothetical protein
MERHGEHDIMLDVIGHVPGDKANQAVAVGGAAFAIVSRR